MSLLILSTVDAQCDSATFSLKKKMVSKQTRHTALPFPPPCQPLRQITSYSFMFDAFI